MDVYENFDSLKDWGLHFIVSLRTRKKNPFFVNLNEWMVDNEIFIVILLNEFHSRIELSCPRSS